MYGKMQVSELTEFSPFICISATWGQILLLDYCRCCCSVTQSCPTFCDPTDCSKPGFPVLYYLPQFAQTHVHWVSNAIQPSHPLSPFLLLPSIFPSIRVFPNEPALHIKWPEYRNFSVSISPSNEHSGLISFSVDWVWSSCNPRDSQECSSTPQLESISSLVLSFLYGPNLTSRHDYWKKLSFDYTHFCHQQSGVSVSAF